MKEIAYFLTQIVLVIAACYFTPSCSKPVRVDAPTGFDVCVLALVAIPEFREQVRNSGQDPYELAARVCADGQAIAMVIRQGIAGAGAVP